MNHIFKIPPGVSIFIIAFISLNYCEKTSEPKVATAYVIGITQTTSSSGGKVTNNEGDKVTARSVYWGTAQNPIISSDKTIDGVIPYSIMTPLLTLPMIIKMAGYLFVASVINIEVLKGAKKDNHSEPNNYLIYKFFLIENSHSSEIY